MAVLAADEDADADARGISAVERLVEALDAGSVDEQDAAEHRPRRVDRHKHACIGQVGAPVRDPSRGHDGPRQYKTRRASTTGQGRIECNGGAEQLKSSPLA